MTRVDHPHVAKKPSKKGPATKKQRLKREVRRIRQALLEGRQQ